MDIELAKRMMDACYQGKRIRDMLPALPEGLWFASEAIADGAGRENCDGYFFEGC